MFFKLFSDKKLLILLILSLLEIPHVNFGQTVKTNLESQVRTAYIFNFTKFLDWKENNSDKFYLTVIGNGDIISSLFQLAGKEKINGKDIVVNEVSDLNDIEYCNILYLQSEDKNRLYDTLKKIKGKKILLITNAYGFAERGAGINFLKIGDKIKFEINRRAIEEAGIIPNTRLLALAVKIFE